MAVTATNLVAGPATLYGGAFGATEPASTAVGSVPSSATWTDFGGTNDGTTLSVKLDYFDLEVDQIVDKVGSRLQDREITVKTVLAEPTLTNLKTALNGGTISTSAGLWSAFEPLNDSSATQPNYTALIVDGYAPGLTSKRRRFIIRKVLNVESVDTEYKKDGQTMIPVSFRAHYVSSSTSPFVVHDEL
jgi:hypothetical protein